MTMLVVEKNSIDLTKWKNSISKWKTDICTYGGEWRRYIYSLGAWVTDDGLHKKIEKIVVCDKTLQRLQILSQFLFVDDGIENFNLIYLSWFFPYN